SVIRVPPDGAPVPVDPETGAIRHEGMPGSQLELGVEQLVEAVQPRAGVHVLETRRVHVGKGSSEMHVDRRVDVAGHLEAAGGRKRGRGHELPYAADDSCVASHDVDGSRFDQLVEGPVAAEVLAQADEHARSPAQIGYERGETFGEGVLDICEVELLDQAKPPQSVLDA